MVVVSVFVVSMTDGQKRRRRLHFIADAAAAAASFRCISHSFPLSANNKTLRRRSREREIENRSSTSNQNQMSHTQICRTRRSESEETDRVAGTVNDWNSFSVSRSS